MDCDNADFYIVSKNNLPGEIIEFYNETPNAQKWEWHFGDNSKKEIFKNISHKYKKPGIYIVTLIVNGECLKQKSIRIKKIQDLMEFKIPKIICPAFVKVGDSVSFSSDYKDKVYSWEWSFGETANLDNTERNPTYVYRTPGEKKISLIINGNIKSMASQSIFVQSKEGDVADENEVIVPKELFVLKKGPLKKDPAEEFAQRLPVYPTSKKADKVVSKAKVILLSEEQFEILLLGVANQTKTKEDFLTYICDNYKIPVLKNDSEIISFHELCRKIKGKTIKIEALTLKKDPKQSNCIVGVSIVYKIRRHLIWMKD